MRKYLIAFSLSVFSLLATLHPARAWDIWLLTSQRRILIIHDADTIPWQSYVITHDPAPEAFNYPPTYQHSFGQMAFAPDGHLYAIALTIGTPSTFYTIDPATGHIQRQPGTFPFEWGNALYFDPLTGRGYTGGGLKSWQPYRWLEGFYTFTPYDPNTAILWHDMRPDYPQGGYTGGYALTNGYLYATWGLGDWNRHETHLLQITLDDSGSFVAYDDLGIAETQGIAGGFNGLVSDGNTLYAVSPDALYRVVVQNGHATYIPVFTFALQSEEIVVGATAQFADLSLTYQPASTAVTLGEAVTLITTLRNDGPYPATDIQVSIPLTGSALLNATADQGAYDANSGMWNVPALAVGQSATLTLTIRPEAAGAWQGTAEITAADQTDPDSVAAVGLDEDDLHDGLPDDDEAMLTLTVTLPKKLPSTGFPHHLTGTPPQSQDAITAHTTTLTLEIPRLGIRTPILQVPAVGDTWRTDWLHGQVGWLEGSAFPTRAGNTVLAGHVWGADNRPGIFAHLKDLRYGDHIFLRAWGQTYVYSVTTTHTLQPDQVGMVFKHAEQDVLTLLTCSDYQPETDHYRHRYMVRAVLIAIHPSQTAHK